MEVRTCKANLMHENVHGHGNGRMSRSTIVTPKFCPCTLVSTMVVLIIGDMFQGRECGEYNDPRSFEVQIG